MNIKSIIEQSIVAKKALLSDNDILKTVNQLIQLFYEKLKKGNRIWLAGNGGSAADALHIAAEFSGRFYLERKALPVEALNVNMAAITAISNDYGYEQVFARMLEAKALKGDVLWLFSTSGTSPNIIQAAKKANEMEVPVVVFTGKNKTELHALADYIVAVPSVVTPRIQEAHMLLAHIISELTEKKLYNE